MRLTLLAAAALALVACQAPFGSDRHRLEGFRIAAVTVEPASEGMFRPRAALVVDGRLWSDQAVDLSWTAGAETATGARPELPWSDTLALVATAPDGTVREAVLDVPARRAVRLEGVELSAVELGPDLTVDARHAAPTSPAEFLAPGAWGRLDAVVTGEPMTRWMATAGTFLELDADSADWAAADVTLDDGEIAASTPLAPGAVTLLALAVGGDGDNDFLATELWVGAPSAGVRVGGRWMAMDSPATGEITVTLLADDAAPTGLRLEAADAADPLPCGEGERFDPAWLLDGTCLRSELVGARVVVDAR